MLFLRIVEAKSLNVIGFNKTDTLVFVHVKAGTLFVRFSSIKSLFASTTFHIHG